MGDDWAGYVGRFHAERPGITERVLGREFDGGRRPYEWLVSALFGEAGLTLVGEERRRFVFRLGGVEDAEVFLDSLYLPSASERRLRACSRLGASMPIPVRRLIATR
ncbi:hypothetical protein [Glycomyces salinus]|uniref:hypothetical protein n=1 Tax=Glycomyces salinus TaxID=980294 RepID=UPI0018ED348F|nr:hypothetical protein [Glycomyces salinus]